MARFVPSLVACPAWSLRARVMLGARSADLLLENGGAIAFARTLPAAPDGRLARRVARVLRSVGVRVDLHPRMVDVGRRLVVPDFALEWSAGRVLVDVVPFATPEYLASKRDAIHSLSEPMLVCIDERFVSKQEPWMLPYRRDIDAWALFAAAKNLLESTGPPDSPLGSAGISVTRYTASI